MEAGKSADIFNFHEKLFDGLMKLTLKGSFCKTIKKNFVHVRG